MADTRIFRMQRYDGSFIYGGRKSVTARTTARYPRYHFTAIHATNAEATDGWTDVTEEFLGPRP